MNERYEIRRKIGQGGLGTVYQAFDNQLKRDVAIKRLFAPVDAAGNIDRASTAEKLMREATALSRLNHQNIVSVFDVGVDADGGYVVMELLNGETLTETITRGTLTLEDFHQVVIQTLEALIAAESQDMLHRDLKPSNIMVIWLPSGRFLVKVLDFGLAKVSAQPALQTIDHNNSVLGSIFYMAPEQFERRELGFSTDLYSMGCIYYFCLAGRDPFTGRSVADVMNAHLENRVIPLHELRPDLPAQVCDWVMWLLRREMGHRPQTAQIALDNFPLVEGSGGGVQVAPQNQYAIPVAAPASPSARPPIFSGTGPSPKTGSTRIPIIPGGGAAASPATGSTRVPVIPPAGPSTKTGSTRVPASTSGPVSARSVTASTRVPVPRHTTATTTVAPSRPTVLTAEGDSQQGFPKPLLIALGAGAALLAVLSIVFATLKPGTNTPVFPNSSTPATSTATLVPVPLTRLADAGEIQFSFTLPRRSDALLRFSLLQRDQTDPNLYHGYAFDVDQSEPASLSIRRYSGEPASRTREVLPAEGALLSVRREGTNVKVQDLVKVELRAKLTGGRNLTFAATLWNSNGETGVYAATDTASPLTTIEEYGFRAVPLVLENIADQRFAATKPAATSSQSGSLKPSADRILLSDDFDSGKSPSLKDDWDAPYDRAWEGSGYLAKASEQSNLVNGTNALGISAGKNCYARFPCIQLSERDWIEATYSCRVEGDRPGLRTVIVDEMTRSSGYMVEIAADGKILIHKYLGKDAKTFSVSNTTKVSETPKPSGDQAVSLDRLNLVRVTISRPSSSQVKIELKAECSGGKTLSASFTDSDGPAFAYSHFGILPLAKKGRVVLDNVRIVSTAALKPFETVLLDDDFDTGANPSIKDDPDAPNDHTWQESPSFLKADAAKKISNLNGTNAVAISTPKHAYVGFAGAHLVEDAMIEAGFSCRIEEIDALRFALVNKMTESRGYVVEIGSTARVSLHEMRGKHARDYPIESGTRLHEGSPPSSTPPLLLRQLEYVRISVARLQSGHTKVQITTRFQGGKTATTSFTDTKAPTPYHFTCLGVRPRGSKGRVLLDDVRVVYKTAPAN